MLPPGAIIELKIHKNTFAAEPHWELTALSQTQTPSWFSGAAAGERRGRKGGKGMEGKGREGKGREGERSPLFKI